MSFNSLLNQTITLYTKNSYDAYGREVVGAGANHLARVQAKTKSILLPNGQLQQIDAVVFLKSDVTIDINDRMDYLGTKYKVVGKSTAVVGSGGTHHLTVQIAKWQET